MRLVIVEAVVLMLWFLWSARTMDATGNTDWAATLTLFSPYNIGSVLIQFAVVLVVLIGLNRWLAKSGEAEPAEGS